MIKVKAVISETDFLTDIFSKTNSIISDEPVDNGGQDKGFNPYELLASSLASCTCATLKMYLNRKDWGVKETTVEVILERDKENNITRMDRKISFNGNLTEEQKQRLLAIANACPVHKILTNPIQITTSL
ncbi:OsmC family protein [Flavobacterium sp. H122]|uniref:OsmC family protein n=1 Tax=Flavobacterium sp. H122 TaxID=2529860 RepID=UPI0010AAD4D4|nr:OsmC family protein [Flavobacterium sp. H122]